MELAIAIAAVALGLAVLGILWYRRRIKREAKLGRRVKPKIDLFRDPEDRG